MRTLAALLCTLLLTGAAGVPRAFWRDAAPLQSMKEQARASSESTSLQVERATSTPLPVVMWHGMGDSCCSLSSIGAIKSYIEDRLGVFVYSIATGPTLTKDVLSSYFGDVNDQVAKVCAELRAIPELQGGYNAVGFSQGGQFMRAMVERCQHTGPRVHTLITMGAQHQGVMNIPGCGIAPPDESQASCKLMQRLLATGAYLPYIRDHVVQAQYFKDPLHLDEYLAFNPFLPDINNEKEPRNRLYADNLASLQQLVLFRFTEDETVVPRDSAWFSFFDGSRLVPLSEQALYTQDWLGLKRLDAAGRLVLDELPGPHMHFSLQAFGTQVVDKYLV